jgi:DNA-binding MarR family transcriptional regulator
MMAGERSQRLERIEKILLSFKDSVGELRCIGSARLVKHGVSMTHLHVMWLLQRHGEMTMSRMADLIDVSLSNATGLVDRMEERGLVERVRVPDDRRVVVVRLTPVGARLLDEIEVLRGDLMAKVVDRLTDHQIDRLVLAMTDFRTAIEAVLSEDPEAQRHLSEHGPDAIHTPLGALPGPAPALTPAS